MKSQVLVAVAVALLAAVYLLPGVQGINSFGLKSLTYKGDCFFARHLKGVHSWCGSLEVALKYATNYAVDYGTSDVHREEFSGQGIIIDDGKDCSQLLAAIKDDGDNKALLATFVEEKDKKCSRRTKDGIDDMAVTAICKAVGGEFIISRRVDLTAPEFYLCDPQKSASNEEVVATVKFDKSATGKKFSLSYNKSDFPFAKQMGFKTGTKIPFGPLDWLTGSPIFSDFEKKKSLVNDEQFKKLPSDTKLGKLKQKQQEATKKPQETTGGGGAATATTTATPPPTPKDPTTKLF